MKIKSLVSVVLLGLLSVQLHAETAKNECTDDCVVVIKKAIKETCVGDCVNGTGERTYANGDKYKGTFKNGKFNGKGVLSTPKDITTEYDGEFVDYKWEGTGTVTFANGDTYTGEFKNGKYVAESATEEETYKESEKISRQIWKMNRAAK